MKKAYLAIFLALFLIPFNTSFSQNQDTAPTLGVDLTSERPFNFKNDDGKTIIVGEVTNTKNFPISGVKVWAGFYDDVNSQPIESVIGTTLLEVIPPFGTSPYIIESTSTSSAITNISVNLLGFNSASPKDTQLVIESGTLTVDTHVTVSGTITNYGEDTSGTQIYLLSYDGFEPPRLVEINTMDIENDMESNTTEDFEFKIPYNSRAASYKLLASSNDYNSDYIDIASVDVQLITKLVNINDVSILDDRSNKLSDITTGNTVFFQSDISLQYSADQEDLEQSYVYYVQVKQSGTQAFVEFIGQEEGSFLEPGKQFPTIEWTPKRTGLYFVETFVWDPNGVPLASKGPIALILVG